MNDFLEEPPKSPCCEYFQQDKCTKGAECSHTHARCPITKRHLEWRLAVNAKRIRHKGKAAGKGTPAVPGAAAVEEESEAQEACDTSDLEAEGTWRLTLQAGSLVLDCFVL